VNPLQGARFEKLTDWEGIELDATILLTARRGASKRSDIPGWK
jgi:hypothetical protein